MEAAGLGQWRSVLALTSHATPRRCKRASRRGVPDRQTDEKVSGSWRIFLHKMFSMHSSLYTFRPFR